MCWLLAARSVRGRLTDAEDDEEDDEGVHHGDDGGGDGGDHGLEGLDAAEEADDAEGAHELDEPVGDVGDAEVDERHSDDEHVEQVPAVGEEALEPVGEGVEDELTGEGDGEDEVEGGVEAAEAGKFAVFVNERGGDLGVHDARPKILQK